jgi:hypothetical protein
LDFRATYDEAVAEAGEDGDFGGLMVSILSFDIIHKERGHGNTNWSLWDKKLC